MSGSCATTPGRVFIVAGEASGDHHAAALVREVRERAPAVSFRGIGGPQMAAAGVEILFDAAELAVMGLVEVLAHFRTIYGALRMMRERLREERPDLLILVDYPGFNLRLAKTAKELGIKVLYYISPQVWAWREHRVHEIGRRVDMMAVVFPFEVSFYERAGVPVRFVGHPLAETANSSLTREQACNTFGLDPARKTVGLFPGSRRSEIKRLLPAMLAAARRIRASVPDVQFLLPLAATLGEEAISAHLAEAADLQVRTLRGNFYDITRACDAVVSASGTATLEVALIGTPLVVVYKMAPLTYRIMRRLVRLPHIALCNIVAQKPVAVELLQEAASPERIAEELELLLLDAERAARAKADFAQVRQNLGEPGGAGNIAELALELLRAPAESTGRRDTAASPAPHG